MKIKEKLVTLNQFLFTSFRIKVKCNDCNHISNWDISKIRYQKVIFFIWNILTSLWFLIVYMAFSMKIIFIWESWWHTLWLIWWWIWLLFIMLIWKLLNWPFQKLWMHYVCKNCWSSNIEDNIKKFDNNKKETKKNLNEMLNEAIEKWKNNTHLKQVDLTKAVFEIMKIWENLHLDEIVKRIINWLNENQFYIKLKKEDATNRIWTINSFLSFTNWTSQWKISIYFENLWNWYYKMLNTINKSINIKYKNQNHTENIKNNDKDKIEEKITENEYKNQNRAENLKNNDNDNIKSEKSYSKNKWNNFIEKLFFNNFSRPIFINNDINNNLYWRIFIFTYMLLFYWFIIFTIFVNIIEFDRHEIMNIIIPILILIFIKYWITSIFKIFRNIFLYIKNWTDNK